MGQEKFLTYKMQTLLQNSPVVSNLLVELSFLGTGPYSPHLQWPLFWQHQTTTTTIIETKSPAATADGTMTAMSGLDTAAALVINGVLVLVLAVFLVAEGATTGVVLIYVPHSSV